MLTSCSLPNHNWLIGLPSLGWVQSIDEVWIVEMDLVWIDTHYWTCRFGFSYAQCHQSTMFHAVFSVHLVHSPEVFALEPNVVVDLIPIRYRLITSVTVDSKVEFIH